MSMLRVTLAALLLTGPLAACGGEEDVARDEPSTRSEPTVPYDYSYTLVVSCFCAYGGVPVRVQVEDGTVVDAVFARSGGRGGAKRGEQAPDLLRLSIADLLAEVDRARAEGAHEVVLEWSEDGEHPTEIWIDRIELAVDDEIGYTISEVELAS